jgi:hypothetical protein
MATKRMKKENKTHPRFDAILRVGDGRGFLLVNPNQNGWRAMRSDIVVTAAHCLPQLPPAHPDSFAEERSYRRLLRAMRGSESAEWCECLFADPVSDTAVLAAPYGVPEGMEALDAFEALIEGRHAFPLGVPPESREAFPVWLLTSDGARLERCQAKRYERTLAIKGPSECGAPGVSGSPILDADGRALAVLNCGITVAGCLEGIRAAVLVDSLPGWLVGACSGADREQIKE